ncbi:Uncharacterized conserved protein, contains HEPN domain [Mucilaginibacter mallensis]|uniref:Uncharacterized conserved protein, contains HEPN domain n=1 Tax=Mucilaginibacter mallensis TaxID=652787 RepID=A0A1H1RMN8_MUCMA|nr:DUF86 domain-containing protein [Mucilaginibacter mallensis]SDS36912.1 Uncharacterized conserved protein, contains HEPN domain [Mucilaginibacter mallensis]
MSNRQPKLLLEDILESAEKINAYTLNLTYEEFIADSKTIDAVVRNFEIIGEAANRLPDELKENHTEIDWFKIRGLRNRIVHNYFGIDHKIIWSTKETYLLQLITQIKQLLNKYE